MLMNEEYDKRVQKGEEKYLLYLVNKRLQRVAQEVSGYANIIKQEDTNESEQYLRYKIKQVVFDYMQTEELLVDHKVALEQVEILSKENKQLKEAQNVLERQEVNIAKNKEKLKALNKQLKHLKDSFNNVTELVGREYYDLKEKVMQQGQNLERANMMTSTLLRILKQKDQEILKLQTEKNYLYLKLNNIL